MLKVNLKKNNRQNGNALFLILIAVALFAALSYAITQSGRSTGTIDRETAMIAASQTTQYPATLETAITRMIITGVATTDVHFGHTTYNSDNASNMKDEANVFDSNGGGVTRSPAPSNLGDAAGDWPVQGTLTKGNWGYKDATDSTNGYYIYNVGSNDAIKGREVVAFLHAVPEAVCQQINKGLKLAYDPLPSQDTPVDYTIGNGVGSTGPATPGGSSNTFGAISSEPFACFKNGDTNYDYYHALIKQ